MIGELYMEVDTKSVETMEKSFRELVIGKKI